MNELQKRYEPQIEEMVAACRRSAALGYVHSHGGNLSMRVDENTVLITPTKVNKGDIVFDSICIVDMDGKALYAPSGGKPTGELPFHLRILNRRPDLRALVHAHPPILTGFAIAGSDVLSQPFLPEPVLEVGPMVMVPYAEPLSDELARNFDEAIERSNGFLMENHGALMGSTEGIKRALELLEMMEAAARSVLVAHMLGGFKAIPRDEVANLDRTLRTRGMAFPGRPGVVGSLVDLMFDE